MLAACGQREGDSASPVSPVLTAARPESQEQGGCKVRLGGGWRLPQKDKKVLSDQLGIYAKELQMEHSAELVPCRVGVSTESFPAVPVHGLALPPFLLCSAEVKAPDSTAVSARGDRSAGASPVPK